LSEKEKTMSIRSHQTTCTALAFGLLTAASLAAEAPEAPHPTDLYTCFSTYALCISAPCTEIAAYDENEDGTKEGMSAKAALCECEVVTGYNIGSGDCTTRYDLQNDGYLVSTYSVAQTDAKGLLDCAPEEGLVYADCFNFPCQIDKDNPAKAHCTCPILPASKSGYVTRGGECQQSACDKLWSGAPPQTDTGINELLWAQLHFVKLNPPVAFGSSPPVNACPAGD
jgi:hypothetical protein